MLCRSHDLRQIEWETWSLFCVALSDWGLLISKHTNSLNFAFLHFLLSFLCGLVTHPKYGAEFVKVNGGKLTSVLTGTPTIRKASVIFSPPVFRE